MKGERGKRKEGIKKGVFCIFFQIICACACVYENNFVSLHANWEVMANVKGEAIYHKKHISNKDDQEREQLLRNHGRWHRQPFLAVQHGGEAETVSGLFRNGQKFATDDGGQVQTDCADREHVYRDERGIQAVDHRASAGFERRSNTMRAGTQEYGSVYCLRHGTYQGTVPPKSERMDEGRMYEVRRIYQGRKYERK